MMTYLGLTGDGVPVVLVPFTTAGRALVRARDLRPDVARVVPANAHHDLTRTFYAAYTEGMTANA